MKVLVCDSISTKAVERMRQAGIAVDVNDKVTPEELLQIVDRYDALVVRSRTKVRKPVLDAATQLKVVVRGGVGVDNIDVAYAEAKGVKIMNTPAASTDAVAELTVGLLFALARPIVQATASMQAGEWEKTKFSGVELNGKTLGVIGLGRIGRGVAQRAAALGMTVLGYDSFPVAPASYMTKVELAEIFAKADFITLHIPLSESTHHLIGAESIAQMKDGVRIVNCARGGTIDEEALYAALVAGKIAGAALDVFETEPLADRKLFGLPQVIGSPHVGASTKEATARIGDEVADLLIAFNTQQNQ